MEDSTQDLRLIEPPSADGLMPHPITWGAWCVIGGVILLLVVIAILIWRNARQSPAATKEDLEQKARADAMAALADCAMINPNQTATECSLIVRRYLSELTGDPALYETHEQWVMRHDALEDFNDSFKEQIGELFSKLAALKYAPEHKGDSPAAIIENSRYVVDAAHREIAE